MGGLLQFVEMESTLYILLWHGEIGHLVLLWNLLGHLMESMLFERVLQKLKFSLKTSRFVTLHYFQFIDCIILSAWKLFQFTWSLVLRWIHWICYLYLVYQSVWLELLNVRWVYVCQDVKTMTSYLSGYVFKPHQGWTGVG